MELPIRLKIRLCHPFWFVAFGSSFRSSQRYLIISSCPKQQAAFSAVHPNLFNDRDCNENLMDSAFISEDYDCFTLNLGGFSKSSMEFWTSCLILGRSPSIMARQIYFRIRRIALVYFNVRETSRSSALAKFKPEPILEKSYVEAIEIPSQLYSDKPKEAEIS